MNGDPPRVLIVAEHASARFGGEAILPLHHFRFLRGRGVDAHLLVHERTRGELQQALGDDHARVHYVPDRLIHKLLWRLGRPLPDKLNEMTLAAAMHAVTQRDQRRLARRLVRELSLDVVHEPIPVSPKAPSAMHGLGAPVVISPMNGGMRYPPAFRDRQPPLYRAVLAFGRWACGPLNRLTPGKPRAAVLLVANERTRDALPLNLGRRAIVMVENGVDLALWDAEKAPEPPEHRGGSAAGTLRVVFLGRLVALKAVDALLDAVAEARRSADVRLTVIGDGPEKPALEAQAKLLRLGEAATFTGFLPQAECVAHLNRSDALALPSLHECGGAVVLEAMAMARPVIATNWGGPADYLDADCGVLVEPDSRPALVTGFARAMADLAADPTRRRAMGDAGRRRVEERFDWNRKVDRMIEVYRGAMR